MLQRRLLCRRMHSLRRGNRSRLRLRPPLPNMMRAEPQMPVSAATTPDYFDYRGIRRGDSVSIKTCLHEYESSCIRNVLRVTGGNVAKAARIMELTPAGLHYRMKVLHIENED